MKADLAHEAVKPRPGRAAPRATKRSGTGYRTLKPDEPATSKVTYTIKLELFPEADRPVAPTIMNFSRADISSLSTTRLTSAA